MKSTSQKRLQNLQSCLVEQKSSSFRKSENLHLRVPSYIFESKRKKMLTPAEAARLNRDEVFILQKKHNFSLPYRQPVPWHAVVPTWGSHSAINQNILCICTDGLLFVGIDESGKVFDRLHIADFVWLKPATRTGSPPPLFSATATAKPVKKKEKSKKSESLSLARALLEEVMKM